MTGSAYTYEELNVALREMRKKSTNVINTCYYFPAELKEKINNGTITYDIQSDGVVVYEHFCDFDSLMFCIGDDSKKLVIDSAKNKLVDIIYNESKPVEKFVDQVLQNSGFSYLCRAYCMVLTDFEKVDGLHQSNNVVFATEDMSEDIVKLWRKVFDPKEVYLQSSDEVKEKILNNQVVVCMDENGELNGAVTSDLHSKENAMIRHVAVSEKARGKGIGYDLCGFYLREREKIGFSRATLWVEDYRKAAMGLYEKLGFKRTGKEMLRYVKIYKGGN